MGGGGGGGGGGEGEGGGQLFRICVRAFHANVGLIRYGRLHTEAYTSS